MPQHLASVRLSDSRDGRNIGPRMGRGLRFARTGGGEARIVSISVLDDRVTAAVEPGPPPARPWDAAGVALLAVAVSAAGAARPSLWFDEAATISAATRSVPALWRMLGNIDAVHGVYYLLMHGWFAVFGATEFASRLSSALAVGLAAGGVVVLGRQISTRAVAVTARCSSTEMLTLYA